MFYNYTRQLPCFDPGFGPNPETDEDGNFWDYQWCTEMLMPASKDGGAARAGRGSVRGGRVSRGASGYERSARSAARGGGAESAWTLSPVPNPRAEPAHPNAHPNPK